MNLYLIDGNSYFYRAYHAIKGLSNSKGLPTNAIYGFTNMVFKIIREKKPDFLAIVFDSPVPTERHRIYEAYKAQRPETPNDLVIQIPYIKEILKAFKITMFEMPGYEADDIICTLARKAASTKIEVFILSGDKDMMQAVGNNIKIYDPMKDITVDEKYVSERFGVLPEKIPEIMALAGDPIDNIPGVKGIGEKTAKELIAKAGNLEELINHPEKITNERLRKMITDNIENIKLSKTLATIDTNIPVDIDIKDFVLKEPDWSTLLNLFSEFEFKSLIKLIPSKGYEPRGQYSVIADRNELLKFLGEEK
jgi:DNA polymerase-1